MRILVGEVSSYKAIVICRYLKKTYPGIEIYTYDHLKFSGRIHTRFTDKHIVLRHVDMASYLTAIAELIRRYKIDLFLPVHSNTIQCILEKRSMFGESLDYMGRLTDYNMLHNKRSVMEVARTVGVRVPEEFKNIISARLPFVGKPPDKSASKGVVYFRQVSDITKFDTEKLDGYVFQEFIKGEGCGYSVYARNGVIQAGYGHLRLAEYPVSGGSSVYRESFYTPLMKEIAEKIMAEVKWTGFVMFEFKYTENGELLLIEVNPRIWGSINQGLQNGVNYFVSIIPLKPVEQKPSREVRTYLGPQVYIAFIGYVLKFNIRPIRKFIVGILSNQADVGLFSDPRGWLSIVLRTVYR